MKPLYYCDHAASTPCRPEVWPLVTEYALEEFGNPSSIHARGRKAWQAVEDARTGIAQCLGAGKKEIIFTSGGSESVNLAIRGAANARHGEGGHVVTTAIEHEAALRACEDLQRHGFEITYLKPDMEGRISPEQVAAAIRSDTFLISVMHANHEVGTIQPVAEIARAARRKRPELLIHSDAVQTAGHIRVQVEELGVDLLSLTAHKFYGPKGVGALYVKDRTKIQAEIAGGGQECGLRSGTESVPLVVGMAGALKLACAEIDDEAKEWKDVRERLANRMLGDVPDCRVNGDRAARLSTNLNMSFRGVQGEDLVLELDRRGICASTDSACNFSSGGPSPVLSAMGLSRSWAAGALRLTFGRACRGLDPDFLACQIEESVAELRSTWYTPSRRGQRGVRARLAPQ